jgi:hypothetical protein
MRRVAIAIHLRAASAAACTAILVSCWCGAQQLSATQDILISHLEKAEFGAAAKLFQYPESYSRQELAQDQSAVSKWLATLFGEIGQIRSAVRSSSSPALVTMSVSGGDVAYWSSRSESTVVYTYAIETERVKHAYLHVALSRVHTHPVRSLEFGLASDSAGASERIAQLSKAVSVAVFEDKLPARGGTPSK